MDSCNCSSTVKKCTCPFSNYVSADGTAFTKMGIQVTSSASATYCSDISYEDAWLNAYGVAKQNAEIVAKNDANIIDQTLDIITTLDLRGATGPTGATGATGPQGTNSTTDFSNYTESVVFSDFNTMNNFQLPTPGSLEPKNYNLYTRFNNIMPATYKNFISPLAAINTVAFATNGDVYIGGNFTTLYSISGTPIPGTAYVAKWSNNTWSALGLGTSSDVTAIAIDSNANVYVGGFFTEVTNTGGVTVTGTAYIAKWSNNTWSALGGGTSGGVFEIAIDSTNTNIYVGGSFFTANSSVGVTVPGTAYIAKWSTTNGTWSALGKGTNSNVTAIAIDSTNANVYVGGIFTNVLNTSGTVVAGTAYVAKWSTTNGTWSALGGGTNAQVSAIAIDSTGTNVYIGGSFTFALNAPNISVWGTLRIAKWSTTNSSWSALGGGTNSNVNTIAIDSTNTNIYVGGFFTTVLQSDDVVLNVDCICQFNTNENKWSCIGNGFFIGFSTSVQTISLQNNVLYIVGIMRNSNSVNSRQNYIPLTTSFSKVTPLGSSYVINNDNTKLYLNSGNTPIYYDTTNNVWAYV